MKPRYTIRDMLLWSLLVALAVGWLTDHRRQQEVIKLQNDVEQRQHQQIGELEAWKKGTITSLTIQSRKIDEVKETVERLIRWMHVHYDLENPATAD